MRLFLRGVFAANTRGKIAAQLELAKLAPHALAVSAGDDAKVIFRSEEPDDAPRACEQWRVFLFVSAHPEAIGFEPFGSREQRGTVNAQPIRRVMLLEFALGPVDAQSMKHREIGAEVGFVGIEERAVPVEEYRARGELCDFHGEGIVSDLNRWEKWRSNVADGRPTIFDQELRIAQQALVTTIAQREDVVATQREVVEGGGITAPAGHIDFLGANNVGCRAHLHAALTQRALDERDFEFDGRAGLKIARSEEINAAGTDIAGYERDGDGLEMIADACETEWQRERCARIVAALARDANGMRGNPRETLWPRLPGWRCNTYCVAFNISQRRHNRPRPLPIRSSPHVLSPKNSLASPRQ
jgi:hypothetical protein